MACVLCVSVRVCACIVVRVLCVCGCVVVRVCKCGLWWEQRVSLPEWSKGLRSGRNVFERVGSNPTADILLPRSATQRTHSLTRIGSRAVQCSACLATGRLLSCGV